MSHTHNADNYVKVARLTTGTSTDLGWAPSPTGGTVSSSTGLDATLTLATGTLAGLLSPTDFNKLSNISVSVAVDLDDLIDLITLTGVAGGSIDLGTFTGITISDNQTIKAALQELETAHEAQVPISKIDATGAPGPTTYLRGDGVWATLPIVTDHGALTGLLDDDHTQYHNDTRGDARYYTQTLLDAGQLDTRYYTESEVDTLLLGKSNVGHTHTLSEVTDVTATFTEVNLLDLAGLSVGWVLRATGASSAAWAQLAYGDLSGTPTIPVISDTPYGASWNANLDGASKNAIYDKIEALEVDLDIDDLKTLTGVAGGSVDLGTFTGITISNNTTIKPALQELETALEAIVQESTDLGYTASPTDGTVTNDTGTDATIPLANTTNAGLLSPADWDKLSFISITQAVDLDALETASHAAVTLSGTGTYLTLVGQDIQVDPITESDITDLQPYLLNITSESIGDLSDVTDTAPANRHVLVHNGAGQYINRLLVEADISDLGTYLTTEVNDLTTAVTWTNVPDVNITQSSVTQHEGAIDHDALTNFAIGEHRVINDAGTSTIELWSSDKISSDIAAVAAGVDHKNPVATSTEGVGNITLSGEQTINGLLTSTSRILVMEQTVPADNGIYVTAAGAWSRATDADADAEVTNGLTVWVGDSGSDVYRHHYILTTADPITVGVTGLTFAAIPDIEFGTTSGTATEGNDTRVPTQDENDALQGTDGAPSNSNRYVTNSDSRLSDARTPTAHASTHITGQSDEIDGDKLDIDWNPTYYTPAVTPAEVDNVDNLTAHLYGIDQLLNSHTHLLAAGATDVTATAAEVNLLDLSGLSTGWVLAADTATTASWQQLDYSDLSGTPDFTIKVSADDTTDDYLFNKLVAGRGITLAEVNPGGNEDISITNSTKDFFNGTFVESFDATVSSNGTTVTLSLEQSGGGDLTMQFSSGDSTLDCTPADTVTLTAGTDVAPQANYIYVLESTGNLTNSTSDWPAGEHIKVAYVYCPSAVFVQADGVYVNQNWNDHLSGSDNMGHLSHIAMRSRRDGAYYFDGIDPNGTDQDTNTSYFNYVLASESYFKSTSGTIMQMHEHSYGAKDSSTDDILVVNHATNAYTVVNDLTNITADATGATLSNKYFNLVFVGVANKGGTYSPLLCLLPEGSYNNLADAENDISGYDVFTIPRAFRFDSSTAFYICRLTLHYSGGLGTLEHESTVDLRGTNVASASGGAAGGGGITDHGGLTGLGDDDHTQYAFLAGRTGGQTLIGGDAASNDLTLRSTSNATKGNVIVEGLQFTDEDDPTKIIDLATTAITTATTRTWTIPDRNLDFSSGGTFAELVHTHTASDITDFASAVNTEVWQDTNFIDSSTINFSATAGVSITASTIDSAIDHDALLNFVADEHVAHSGVTLTAGIGLTGGGTIAASRTFDLDIPGLTDLTDAGVLASTDTFAVYNLSAVAHEEATIAQLQTYMQNNLTFTTDTNLTEEEVQDFAWNVLTGTQTGITVTYQDGTNDVDFVVSGLTVSEFASANISQWTNDSGYLTDITAETLSDLSDIPAEPTGGASKYFLDYNDTGDVFSWTAQATGFNLALGTGAGTVAEGNHTHTLSTGATDVNATAAEINILDLSATALTVGWVYAADGVSTASWRQLLGSEINNDAGWTSNTGDMLLGTIQTVTAAKTFNDNTLLLDDSDSAFDLILRSTSTITTADKSLTFDVNDANRVLTLGGDTTLNGGTHSGTNTGDQTASLTAGTGIAGTTYDPDTASTFSLDFSELTDMVGNISGTTEFILQDGTTESRKAASEIQLSFFNNDSGWTSNVGTVTDVTGGTGVSSTGGATPSIALTVDELAEKTGALVGTDRLVGTSGTTNFAETISGIPLSIFNNDSGWIADITAETLSDLSDVPAEPTGGSAEYYLKWNDTGDTFSWEDISTLGGGVSFGSNNEIPVTNAGGTDFDYDNGFLYDSTTEKLTVGDGAASPIIAFNKTDTGASTIDFQVGGVSSATITHSSFEGIEIDVATNKGVDILVNGSYKWDIDTSQIRSYSTSGGRIAQTSSSLTVPYVSLSQDTDTGVGGDGSNNLSLVSGGNNYLQVNSTGIITTSDYGSGTNTGTATYMAAWDASGNFVEEALPSGGGISTVKESTVSVVTSATSIDFGTGFDVADGGGGEADITLDFLEFPTVDESSLTSSDFIVGVTTLGEEYKVTIDDMVDEMQGISWNFSSTIQFTGGIRDKDGDTGTTGQILSSVSGPDVDWIDNQHEKAITLERPSSSEDITIFFTNRAITVTEMRAVLIGSSTPSVTWTIRHHATDRTNVGNEVVTSGTTTTSTTTGSDVTSFNDATIPADSFVWLETTAQSGTVTELHVTIVYTID